jgi:hypothetical protein
VASSTNSLVVASNGNVGIGTTNPVAKLQVTNTVTGSDNEILSLQNSTSWAGSNAGKFQQLTWRDSSGVVGAIGMLFNATSGTVDLAVNSLYNNGYTTTSTVPFIIKGNGNVGIGTTTPQALLTVNGAIAQGGFGTIVGEVPMFGFNEGAAVINSTSYQIVTKDIYNSLSGLFNAPVTPGTTREYFLLIRKADNLQTCNGVNSYSQWRFYFPWAGKAGAIFTLPEDWGSTNEGTFRTVQVPDTVLQAQQAGASNGYWRLEAKLVNACTGSAVMNVYGIWVMAVDSVSGTVPSITLSTTTATGTPTYYTLGAGIGNASQYFLNVDGNTGNIGVNNSLLVGYTGISSSYGAGNIFASGNVGIGTTAPNALLGISSASKANINLTETGTYPGTATIYNDGNLHIESSTSTYPIWIGANNATNVLLAYGGGDVGIGTESPGYKLQVGNSGDGSVAVANAWNTFSDIRFKKDIQPIHNALQIIESLNGVTFKWKTDNQPSIGFIAQQVQQVLPQIVTTDAQGYESLDYSKITPVLVEAVKQQQTEINQLKSIVCSSNPTNQYCK